MSALLTLRRWRAQLACLVFGHMHGAFYSNHDGSASRQCYRCFELQTRRWYA